MAASLILDTIEGGSLTIGGDATELVRGGIIRGIPTGDDKMLLFDAMECDGWPIDGSPFSDDKPDLVLRRARLQPIGSDVCRVEFVYQTPTLQFGGFSSWVIRKSSRNSQMETARVPGILGVSGGQTIELGFLGSVDGVTQVVPTRPATMRFNLPLTELSATAIVLGNPETDISTWNGYVNDKTFYGRAKGHWLVDEAGTEISAYTGYYTVFARLLARPLMDWSEWKFVQDPITGALLYTSAHKTAAEALAYSHGVINATPTLSGFVRVGPYPTAPLESVLTF